MVVLSGRNVDEDAFRAWIRTDPADAAPASGPGEEGLPGAPGR